MPNKPDHILSLPCTLEFGPAPIWEWLCPCFGYFQLHVLLVAKNIHVTVPHKSNLTYFTTKHTFFSTKCNFENCLVLMAPSPSRHLECSDKRKSFMELPGTKVPEWLWLPSFHASPDLHLPLPHDTSTKWKSSTLDLKHHTTHYHPLVPRIKLLLTSESWCPFKPPPLKS